MLTYFGFGKRDYHQNPIRVFSRDIWSLQAVIKGQIALVTPNGPDFFHSRHLWLFRPGYLRGWTGVPGKPAEVAVFAFSRIPDGLLARLPEDPYLSFHLTEDQCLRIRKIAERVSLHWKTPSLGRILYYEQALLDLSVLVFESLRDVKNEESDLRLSEQRVMLAMKWFEDRLPDNPSLEKVAQAVGVSSSQLRRDFMATLHMSPKKSFNDIRLKRSLEFLHQGIHSVESLAELCGYWSASAFSRAFKAKFGRSPRRLLPRQVR
jgi:AraC-like DNA-binding protein